MKLLLFLVSALLQMGGLTNAQAWTLPEVYRDGGTFLEKCILSTASSDGSEETKQKEGEAEEEEPDCD